MNWLRKKKIAERYDCTPRNVERMWKGKRLPPPQYPFGNDIPANSEEELDEWDRRAVVTRARSAANATAKSTVSDSEMNPQKG
jgi:hypothetical protein